MDIWWLFWLQIATTYFRSLNLVTKMLFFCNVKWIPVESMLKKSLGQGRLTQMNPCQEHVKRKPLGQGRFTHESLSRVCQRNLSVKEEFTYVNPYRETVKENLSAKVNSPKWIPAESALQKPLGQGRFTRESLPRARQRTLSA